MLAFSIPHTCSHTYTHTYTTARVMPQDVQIGLSASVLSTNICFKFDDKVEPRIKYFLLEISSGSSVYKTKHISPPDRMEEITGLAPGTSYHARVIAVYDDQHKSSSKDVPFTTRGIGTIAIITHAQGGIYVLAHCVYLNQPNVQWHLF